MLNNYMTFSEYLARGGVTPSLLKVDIVTPDNTSLTVLDLLEVVFAESYVPVLIDEDPTVITNLFYQRIKRTGSLLAYAHAQAEDIKRMRASVARGTYTETSGDVTAIRPNDGAINPVGGYVDGDTRTNTISTVESDALDRYTGIDVFAPMYRPYIDLFRSCFVNTRILGVC